MTARKTHFFRYMAVAAVFCLICVIYLGRLLYIQLSGNADDQNTGTTKRTVTVQAVRGEIYDRNGNALVTNRYAYDMTLSYSTLAASGIRQADETCLSLMDALKSSDETDKHVEKFFPYEGVYPYYALTEEAADADSIPYYQLQKVLKAIGLKEDASISDVIEYYVSSYDLLATDANGKRLFDDDEVDRLIRLRYDMDAVGFKSAGEYSFAQDVSLSLMTYVKELGLSGVSFQVNVERVYNYPGYASHILGTVGPIYSEEWEYYNEQGYQMNAIVGKSGCELAFESYLHGSDGVLEIEEDASGNIVSIKVKTEPIAGNDVHLTIDIDLQIAAEDGLRDNVAYVVDRANGSTERGANCSAGAAVAIDPDSFDILAIASYPSYDLSTYNAMYSDLINDAKNPLFNRALNGLYAPGSTYKPGVAIAALMEGKINAYSTIYCGGKYTRYGDYQPRCSTHPHAYGSYLNATQAITDSCNCFFYELGYRLGIDTMSAYMGKLGIGQSTGLELGGQNGQLASADRWLASETPGLTLQAAIGQSDNLASPLQLACYAATIANGGTRYSAHLLDSVYAFGSTAPSYTYLQSESSILSSLDIPSDILSSVYLGMRNVVRENDVVARFLSSLPVSVGGKTGTAQNSTGCDNALFICTAPYDDPEIVISVVIEQGYTGGYAAFTAGKILEQYYED